METKGKLKNYRLLLWLGLGLMACSIIINLILSVCGIPNSIEQGPFIFFQRDIFIGICMSVFIVPLVEEFVFRYWGEDTKAAYLIDSTLIPFIAYLVTGTWYISAIALVVFLAITFFLSGGKKFYSMTATTVLIFTFLHTYCNDFHNIHTIFNITYYVGLSLLCTYIYAKRDFWWATLTHSASNLIIILITLIPTTISSDNSSIKIAQLPTDICQSAPQDNNCTEIEGSLDRIMRTIAYRIDKQTSDDPMHKSTFYRTTFADQINHGYYTLHITPQTPHTQIDYTDVTNCLKEAGILRIDTTYENILLLKLENESPLNSEHTDALHTVAQLITYIRNNYGVPLIPGNGLNCHYPINLDWEKLDELTSLEACKKYIAHTLGLSMTELDHSRAQVITFRPRNPFQKTTE